MSRIILFALGTTCLLNLAAPTRADDAEDKAAEFFEKQPFKPVLTRDLKQPGKPVIGLLCITSLYNRPDDEFWAKAAALPSLTELVVIWAYPPTSPEVTDADLKQLAALKHLSKLHLVGLKITDKGFKELGRLKNLTTLGVFRTNITEAGMREISRLNKLTALYLGSKGNTDDLEREWVERSKKLVENDPLMKSEFDPKKVKEFLAEREREVDPVGLKHLALLDNLSTLTLPDTAIEGQFLTDDVLTAFRRGNFLYSLDIAKAKDRKRATKADEVVTFDLSKTAVTDVGLKELKGLTNLESLDLTGTAVTDAWVKRVAVFEKLTTITPAKVTDATLTAAATDNLLHLLSCATADGGKRPSKPADVVSLDLRQTNVTGTGLKELAVFENLVALKLPGKLSDKMLAGLAEAKLLHLFPQATAEGGKQATKPANVISLDLSETDVTAAGLKELKELTNLVTLKLPGKLSDKMLTGLAEARLLHLLPQATAEGGKRATKPADVISLDLSQTDVTDVGLKELKELTNLQSLDLSGTKITDAWVKAVAPFTKLMLVTPAKVTEETIAAARQAKLLPVLSQTRSVTGKPTDELVAALREANLLHALPRATDKNGKIAAKVEDVTSLYLTSSKITDLGLKELAPMSNLTTLSLTDTRVTDAGLKELAVLKELTTLYLFQTKVTEAGVKELQKALPKCKIDR